MTKHTEKPINWRMIYGVILAWLILMIVLMRLFTEAYS